MLGNEPQIHHLLVIEDRQGKSIVKLEAATCSIGRDATNTIVLHSHLVSRQHALLLRVTTPETAVHLFRLIDGNLQGKRSTNGLTVNGKRCFSHELKHGDVITFGGDVIAGYYATANPADVEVLFSGAEDISDFLSNLSDPFRTLASDSEREQVSEAVLVRLASFPELIAHPIVEIDLTGIITYLNPAAMSQLPGIQEIKLEHPVLAGVLPAVGKGQEKFFVREVEVDYRVFEQSVHYIAESDLIRSYLVDITERKRVEASLQQAHDQLEAKVAERTAELSRINEQLRSEIVERQRAEQALRENKASIQALYELTLTPPNFEQRFQQRVDMSSSVQKNLQAGILPLILVVDDDKFTRLQLRQMLQQEGYRVEEVSDGEQCLAAYTRIHPDVILIDAMMPVMDGFTCCTQLQTLPGSDRTPILMITGLDDQASVDRAFAVGASDYVTKPIHWAVLRQRVRRLLQQSHLYKQLEEANQVLHCLAVSDSLTRVANRRWFDEYLDQAWQQMMRESMPLSLVLCDVDFFKTYNDTYGHQAGDECLQQVAKAISQAVKRPTDLVARYGGEEFAVILPNTKPEGAVQVAEEIRAEVKALEITHAYSQVGQYITLSLGIASTIPGHVSSPTALVAAADQALYQAKAEGRDSVRIAMPDEQASSCEDARTPMPAAG